MTLHRLCGDGSEEGNRQGEKMRSQEQELERQRHRYHFYDSEEEHRCLRASLHAFDSVQMSMYSDSVLLLVQLGQNWDHGMNGIQNVA